MRIVIAEDEPKSREGLIRLIRRFTDYEIVGVAENGEEGYRLTEKEKPDLVLSDIKMPVLDGLGMLQKIKDAGIEVQAVLLTGYSEFEYARKALQLQVVEYVLKPMDIDQFLGVLKKVESRIVTESGTGDSGAAVMELYQQHGKLCVFPYTDFFFQHRTDQFPFFFTAADIIP